MTAPEQAEALALAEYLEAEAQDIYRRLGIALTRSQALLAADGLRLLAQQPAPASAEAIRVEIDALRAEHDALRLDGGYRNEAVSALMHSIHWLIIYKESLLYGLENVSATEERVAAARAALSAAEAPAGRDA